MDVEAIRSLYRYDRWVNGLLLEAAERLPAERSREKLGASFDSVHGTLAHVLGAEAVWLGRWHGEAPTLLRGGDLPDLAAVRRRWAENDARLDRFLAELTPEKLVAPIGYTTTEGKRFEQPLWQMMLHLVNHGTHHRSELCEMLTRLGQPPPPTDLIYYYREGGR